MIKTKIILLPFLVVFLVSLACDADVGPIGVTDTPHLLLFYPVKYTGSVRIKNWNVCTTSASAAFTAFPDNTCSLQIQISEAYQDYEGLVPGDPGYGACKASGDTTGWTLYGNFDKSSNICEFHYCNEKSQFSASGFVGFGYFDAHSGLPIACASAENGETRLTVYVDALPIVKP